MDLIKIIEENNLCVRRLPTEVTESHYEQDPKRNREGFKESYWTPSDRYFKKAHGKDWKKFKDLFYGRFPEGRRMITRTKKVKKHGGWWLVKEVNGTGSMVHFNKKYDFLAPTLEGAINLYLKSKDNYDNEMLQ